MKKAWPYGILMVALALPAAVGAESNPLVLEEKVQDIVAWVNDDVILWTDLQESEQAAIQQLMQQKSAGGDLAQQINEIKESVLLRAIWDRLMVQEAERLFDMDSIKKDILDRFMKSKGIGSMEELDKLLEQYFMTREELTDRLVTSAAPEFVLDQQVRANLGVSAEEAKKFYDEHKDYFTSPGSVVFREILIKDSKGSQQAREQAEEIVRQAREGADFEKLVEQYSDAPSKSLGGKIGPVNPKDLLQQVAEVVTSTEVGGVSDPFQTPQGWQIVKVEERVDAQTKPFEEVQKECEEGCRNARFEPAFKKFIEGLWNNSTIEVRKEYADRIPEPWKDTVVLR